MTIPPAVHARPALRRFRLTLAAGAALALASLAVVSAHTVKGLQNPSLATAFVSSPSAGTDDPVALTWGTGETAINTGLKVVCFYVANTSPPRIDQPKWPRVTSVGFELPDSPSGFALVEPLDGTWELLEGRRASMPGHGRVTLDVAIRARVNLTSRRPQRLPGVPPGQPTGQRRAGTRFCVSGPFPDVLPNLATQDDDGDTIPGNIENLLNGVVVGFTGVADGHNGKDSGVWVPTLPLTRPIPMYQ